LGTVLGNRRAILLFVGPALIVYTLVLLVPIGWSIGYSFFSGNPITGFKPVGFANFTQLVHDPAFLQALEVSLKYAAAVTTGQIVFGLLLAMLYHFYLRGASGVVRTLVFFPVVLPTVAVAQLFVKLFQVAPQNGLVNSALQAAGLSSMVHDWLASPNGALAILIGMDIWRAMGFYAVLLYSGLVDIPGDIFESARLDGASGWRLVRYVVIPLMTPLLIAATIFSLNGTLKVFDSVLALTNGGPGTATTPLTLYMYNTAFTYGDYGYGSTIAMALSVLCLAVTVSIFRAARRDVRA
jgi:multiple sugar transport system permease protein/raffinose/stachyose/melibiose transport system permease protein